MMSAPDHSTLSQRLRGKTGKYLLVVLLASFILYLPSLKNDFVNNDDTLHFLNNPAVRGLDARRLTQIFTTTTGLPTYIPLTTLSFAVEYHFFKYNPFVYHLNNLLLHLAVTALLFYFALQVGLSARAAFAAALLFGIHPMHVESVAWVTERKDVLYSFFYMLALCIYLRYRKNGDKMLYIATLVLAALSTLAKPMALSLPLIMLLTDWYLGRRVDQKTIVEKLPHFITVGLIALVTYLMNARNPIQHGGQAPLLWIWCFTFYLHKFFIPTDLIIFNKFPKPVTLANPEYALSVLIFVVLLWALWRFRKQRLFLFAVAFYFFSVFFLLRFDDIKYLPPVSSRYMYLPSLGICFLLGYGADRLLNSIKREGRRNAIYASLIGIAVLLAAMSFNQQKVWRSSIEHWTHELKYDPDNGMALVNRGEAYRDIGQIELAFKDFDRSVTKDPEYPEGYNSRGLIYGMKGELDLALRDFEKVIELKPNFDEAYNNIGIVYSLKGKKEEAAEYFRKALKIDPLNVEAYYNLGEYDYAKKDFDAALKNFQSALIIDPNFAPAYNRRGLIHGVHKEYRLALNDLNRAIALNPRNSEIYKNRGVILEHMGRFTEAIENYNTALAIDPRYADAYYARGNVNAQRGRYEQAGKDFASALLIDPRHAGAKKGAEALKKLLTQKKTEGTK